MIINLDDKDRKVEIEFLNEKNEKVTEAVTVLFEFDELGENLVFYLSENNSILCMKLAEDGETLSYLEEDEEEIASDLLNDFLNENEFIKNGKPFDIFEEIETEE
ncbi:hypothetical protein [Mesomycoplasma lagogenitalium]|uniref:DUF1292 domain-containing protein n=1 Tax=Mesomycoplasma lagogenitalium TaxID=171286 RepID=A0ABY8LV80_9BACT|nr:hypothetical protein [Mesomycoplasma lagogenitalium]WGI36433.1 hypothetical protein QEG99_03120 [Mesomycoplasma lagogenitalium]